MVYSNPELSRPASNRVRSEFEIRAGKLFMFAFLQLNKYRISFRPRKKENSFKKDKKTTQIKGVLHYITSGVVQINSDTFFSNAISRKRNDATKT